MLFALVHQGNASAEETDRLLAAAAQQADSYFQRRRH
jgi:hypothetical protein